MRKLIALAVSAVLLSGCATPTAYAPSPRPGGVGFSERPIEADRWRVAFTGGGGAPAPQVEDFALLRAAQVALAHGYDWFEVDARHVMATGYQGATLGLGVGGASFGRHSAVGVGGSTGIPLGGGPQLTCELEVRFGHGPRPQSANAYDAREIDRTIGARVGAPR